MADTKYIFVTGGVSSSLGKGIIAASLAKLLQARGYSVTIQKLDPYINVDPGTGETVDQVDPLVRSTGVEAGLRGFVNDKLNLSFSLWQLKLDSELLFVGDAGNTEASRASKRKGAEVALYYQLDHNWSIDLEYAYTDAEFTDAAPEGDHIPGAIKNVVQAGVSAHFDNGLFGSLRARHFGERPLVEDNSITSDASTVFNLRAGYGAFRVLLKTFYH